MLCLLLFRLLTHIELCKIKYTYTLYMYVNGLDGYTKVLFYALFCTLNVQDTDVPPIKTTDLGLPA